MAIMRLDITGINCSRFDMEIKQPLKVMTSAEPVNVTKKKIGKQDFLLVEFNLKTTYEPKIGELKVSGIAYYTDDKLDDKYEKDKKGNIRIKSQVIGEVAQIVFTTPAILAVNMAKELRLPMPIQFPRVEMKKQA
jgi:hypothetical protein